MVAKSPEMSFGRIKGTSAPYSRATFFIFSSSVETITLSMQFDSNACLITLPINGIPASNLRFLPFNPLEPPLAQIIAITLYFFINFFLILFENKKLNLIL